MIQPDIRGILQISCSDIGTANKTAEKISDWMHFIWMIYLDDFIWIR
jgi:hypothetical protein